MAFGHVQDDTNGKANTVGHAATALLRLGEMGAKTNKKLVEELQSIY